MAEGTPSQEDQELYRQTVMWTRRCLAMADGDDAVPVGAMAAGFLDAAAVVLATEWKGEVGGLKKAWEDAMRGFGLDTLLWAWAQRPDVRPAGHKTKAKES